MKKIITTAILATAIFSSQASAMDYNIMPISATLTPNVTSIEIEDKEESVLTSTQELLKKYELVLRNNKILSDYDYNSTTYYTTKIKTDDLIVPKEIMEKATKIYFLVEEWNNRIYFKESSIMEDEPLEIDEVKSEYNYKIVDFIDWQDEYIFENKDLIKSFEDDKNSSVTIKLMAEFSETEKVALANSVYVSIWTKANVLNALQNQDEYSYFGYYNSNDLETYLEKKSESLSRSDYKEILTKADKRIDTGLVKNNSIKEWILESITEESDFSKNVEKYSVYSETENLFNSLARAVKNQLQNVRAFDAIDSILK